VAPPGGGRVFLALNSQDQLLMATHVSHLSKAPAPYGLAKGLGKTGKVLGFAGAQVVRGIVVHRSDGLHNLIMFR
jgi:hypothetical protein